jgi:hypothetical protein
LVCMVIHQELTGIILFRTCAVVVEWLWGATLQVHTGHALTDKAGDVLAAGASPKSFKVPVEIHGHVRRGERRGVRAIEIVYAGTDRSEGGETLDFAGIEDLVEWG